jgi:hypothetical protein
MIPKEIQMDIAKKMEQFEQAMSELYINYAKLFPKFEPLWRGLAVAETEHADWLHVFQARVADGMVHFNEAHIALADMIQTALEEIDREIEKAKKLKMLPIDALSAALRLEKSALEKGWCNSFDGDSDVLKRVLTALATDTNKHAQQLQELFDAEVEAMQKQQDVARR